MISLLTGIAASTSGGGDAVIAGLGPFDDAAVFRVSDDLAVVSTIDFFPPVVDDPADYGRIAAANAVSDIYAMGAEVAFALTVCGFPQSVPLEVIASANRAMAELVAECGASILGGHTIRCAEPMLGLAVTGLAPPDRIWRKSGARNGDAVLLSKPLGTGVLVSRGESNDISVATRSMATTNHAAALALKSTGDQVHAVTDVTGYGLLGHAFEIAERSGASLHIDSGRVPALDGALAALRSGIRTSADAALRDWGSDRILAAADVEPAVEALLYDPQTSGGLLAAVHPAAADALTDQGFIRIGQVTGGPAKVVVS
jgi:selenide,water dikinase